MTTFTAIVQARMGSSRLPGKVLMPLLGEPMLLRMVERVRRASQIDRVLVATSTEPGDDPVAALCQRRGILAFRGHHTDLLDRFYHAAKTHAVQHVVRLTADCPLVDPGLLDEAIAWFRAHEGAVDFLTNVLPPTYPDGLDYSIFSFAVLEQAHREATLPSEREHVVPWIWKHAKESGEARFVLKNLRADGDYSGQRWTVDYPADFEFVQRVYERLYPTRPDFSWRDVWALVDRDPSLQQVAAKVIRDEGYLKSLKKDQEQT